MHVQIHCEVGMNTSVQCQGVYGWHSESIQNYWWSVCVSKAQSAQRDCQLSAACQTLGGNWTMSLMINLSHPLAVRIILLCVFPFMITLLLQTVDGLGKNSPNSDQLLTIGQSTMVIDQSMWSTLINPSQKLGELSAYLTQKKCNEVKRGSVLIKWTLLMYTACALEYLYLFKFRGCSQKTHQSAESIVEVCSVHVFFFYLKEILFASNVQNRLWTSTLLQKGPWSLSNYFCDKKSL